MDNQTLAQQQHNWAVAWQDHGDRRALGALVDSVEPLGVSIAAKYARSGALWEDMESAYRLAAVEAAARFDRRRPDGFASLCAAHMKWHVRVVVRHARSPVSGSTLARVGRPGVIDTADADTLGLLLAIASGGPEGWLAGVVEWLLSEADLDDREMRILARYKTEESQTELAPVLGITSNRVGQLEKRALAKVRAVAEQRGLSLADLL